MKKTAEEFFEAFTPELEDDKAFMEGLERELEKVEPLHRACEENVRQGRHRVLAAALTGVVIGGAGMAFVLLNPSSGTEFSLKLGLGIVSFTLRNVEIVLLAILAVPASLFVSLRDSGNKNSLKIH